MAGTDYVAAAPGFSHRQAEQSTLPAVPMFGHSWTKQ
jgi:hypothetical protein